MPITPTNTNCSSHCSNNRPNYTYGRYIVLLFCPWLGWECLWV